MAWVTGRVGADCTLDFRQSLEEILHDRGYRSIALGRPNARLEVDFVADGYGDVSHGFAFVGLVFAAAIDNVRQERVIFCKTLAVEQTPSAERRGAQIGPGIVARVKASEMCAPAAPPGRYASPSGSGIC